jgi:hypothetical protein
LHGFGIPLVAGDHIHFVTFDFTAQGDRFLPIGNALPQLHGHFLSLGC